LTWEQLEHAGVAAAQVYRVGSRVSWWRGGAGCGYRQPDGTGRQHRPL